MRVRLVALLAASLLPAQLLDPRKDRRDEIVLNKGKPITCRVLDQHYPDVLVYLVAGAEEWVRLGMLLLGENEHDVLLWRQWENLTYGEIGARLDVAEDAARMRVARALQKLAEIVVRLKAGKLDEVLGEE